MNYIVLDMEWNQPWPGSPSAKKVLPVSIRGEIIQIGAVRLTADRQVADEFQVMVRPKFYRKLNKRVSKLTGIKETRLKEEGIPFPEAMAHFETWCGEDPVFLTWGFDDIMILRENLRLFDLPEGWTERWYNAQMIFNAQTDGSTAQKALKTAMEMFSIESTRPAHDALGDAYHTALICARLDLERGIREYGRALKSHEDGFHGAELPAVSPGRSTMATRAGSRPCLPWPLRRINAPFASGRCWVPAGLPSRDTGIWTWPPAGPWEIPHPGPYFRPGGRHGPGQPPDL